MALSHFPRNESGFPDRMRTPPRETRGVGIDPAQVTVDGTYNQFSCHPRKSRRCRLNPVSDGPFAVLLSVTEACGQTKTKILEYSACKGYLSRVSGHKFQAKECRADGPCHCRRLYR